MTMGHDFEELGFGGDERHQWRVAKNTIVTDCPGADGSGGSRKVVPSRLDDSVNHPNHYNEHPSGIECIDIVEHMSFNVGNAVKYLWRAGLKSKNVDEDLAKAVWYIERERKRLRTPSPQKAPGAPLASGRKP